MHDVQHLINKLDDQIQQSQRRTNALPEELELTPEEIAEWRVVFGDLVYRDVRITTVLDVAVSPGLAPVESRAVSSALLAAPVDVAELDALGTQLLNGVAPESISKRPAPVDVGKTGKVKVQK